MKNKTKSKSTKPPTQDPGSPTEGQIRATAILAHVIKEGDTYPLPPLPLGYISGDVFYDVPESVLFQLPAFTNLTKSDFARRLSTAESQISRWIKAGLPVRPDGRIDWWQAEEWKERYDFQNEEREKRGWRE